MNARVLVIDHRDSFVFNLVEDLRRLGAAVDVVRSSAPLDGLRARVRRARPDLLLLSPGPGTPEEAVGMRALLAAEPELPVLGVCLGLQVIALEAGGAVGRAPEVVHGRAHPVWHGGDPLFEGLPAPFPAARYHSLSVTRFPESCACIAWTDGAAGRVPMALRHRRLPRVGLQFHPESVLTPSGPALLANALREAVRGTPPAPTSNEASPQTDEA